MSGRSFCYCLFIGASLLSATPGDAAPGRRTGRGAAQTPPAVRSAPRVAPRRAPRPAATRRASRPALARRARPSQAALARAQKSVEAARQLYSTGRPAEALKRLDEMTLREFLPTAQVLRALISHRLGRTVLAERQLREVIARPESSAAERLFAREVLERLTPAGHRPAAGQATTTRARRWPAPLRADTSAYRWRYLVRGGEVDDSATQLGAPDTRITPAPRMPTPPRAPERRPSLLQTDDPGALPRARGPSAAERLDRRARAHRRAKTLAAFKARRFAEARRLLLGLRSRDAAVPANLALLGKAQVGAGDLSGALRTVHRLEALGAEREAEILRSLIERADAER